MNESTVKLLKMCDLIGIYFLLPLCLIIVEIIIVKKKNKEIDYSEIIVRWLHFCVFACGSFAAGITQAFFPQFTATMLQLPSESYIVIRELGYATLGIGIVSALALKFPKWRYPISIARAIFILCAILIHFERISVISISEVLAIAVDVWIVLVAIFIIVKDRKTFSK